MPFLEVIRSEHITGPITGLALVALKKFVDYGFLTAPLARKHSNSGTVFFRTQLQFTTYIYYISIRILDTPCMYLQF